MTWASMPRSEGAGGLTYWKEGNGPPLILIHGVGLRAEAWGGVVPKLSVSNTVYAVDMPGHGHSPLGTVSTLSDYTDRFSEFAQSLDEPVVVAGHSMGAMIALDFAIRGPKNLSGVAAMNAIYRRTPAATVAVQARAAELQATGQSDPDATLSRWFGPAPKGAKAKASLACRNWLTNISLEGYARAYAVFSRHDGPTDDALRKLLSRALFQTGSNDPNSTPDMSRAMSALAPMGQIDIVEGAAHMMPMTHPEAVCSGLQYVLTKKEGVR